MALKSDDFDIKKTWLRTSLGGNGDYYIEITTQDMYDLKISSSVRISMSGGYTKDNDVKLAVSNLFKAMEKAKLNEFIYG